VEADVEVIRTTEPEVVILATGGRPAPLDIPGAEHVRNTWDILSGRVQPGQNILIYDSAGQHQALNMADFASERGSLVEIATPDQMIGEEVGGTARKSFLKRLYARNVIMSPSHHLVQVYPEGNALIAVLREHYSGVEFEREVTQIVNEAGTVPVDELYFALKPLSINLGELDQPAFLRSEPQSIAKNPNGSFQLFRIGDAVMSRNVHAAIFDGARIARGV
jgi:pyruvate/2-oxoglutarate dehydrogenase complex dihydrolipoamide dehydrogenase (E3) component